MALIRITLRSDLCVGSGEAVGVTVDNDICISPEGLPYIPGRCIKGCLRQAAERLKAYGCPEAEAPGLIEALFGTEFGREGLLHLHRDAVLPGAEAMTAWLRANRNVLPNGAARALNVEKLFTYIRGQTAMENGVAAPGSLRNTRMLDRYNKLTSRDGCFQETCLEVSVSLRAPSETGYSAEELTALLEKSCQALRHMGSKRNRGLGNVKVELLHAEDLIPARACAALSMPEACNAPDEEKEICFQISLDASVTLPGCDEDLLEIPARSVIGCAAAAYLRTGKADDPLFQDLFLNGTVRWSALTPVSGGQRSTPTPLMLVYLKNAGRYCNRYVLPPSGEKQKTLDGTFAAQTKKGFRIVSVDSHSRYHHSTKNGGTLYIQNALDSGTIYGGTVSLPANMTQTVLDLLKQTEFTFGRSRSAQYAACSLYGEPQARPFQNATRSPKPGEPVYVVLQSDLLLSLDGIYQTDNQSVRAFLAQELKLDKPPEKCIDYCQYHTIGGYHFQWQLQKPQVSVVRGGSVYAFCATGSALPSWKCFGELQQEGFGLCRIYTAEEMKQLREIEKTEADQATPQESETEQCRLLKSALLVQASREQIRAFIQNYNAQYGVGVLEAKLDEKKNNSSKQFAVRPGMIGRLRLILSEAESYEDFQKRVETIKESDKNSNKTYSDLEVIRALLRELFGCAPTPSVLPMLRQDDMLAKAIEQDKDAQTRLSELWREPLDMLLHLAYYTRGRR